MEPGPPRGSTRDNGLRCGNYAAIADLDPRVADSLLQTLRDAGIAAYAAPTPGTTGGAMETRLPTRPTDRLWVDDQQIDRARELVNEETADDGDADETDIDTAWQQVLASLQSSPASPVPPWPVSEDLDSPTSGAPPVMTADDSDDVDDPDDHFVPPPPPPLPKLQPVTVGALLAIAVGLLILATNFQGGSFTTVAIIAIIAGVVSLIWHMRNGPPTDSGWDDGAVV